SMPHPKARDPARASSLRGPTAALKIARDRRSQGCEPRRQCSPTSETLSQGGVHAGPVKESNSLNSFGWLGERANSQRIRGLLRSWRIRTEKRPCVHLPCGMVGSIGPTGVLITSAWSAQAGSIFQNPERLPIYV